VIRADVVDAAVPWRHEPEKLAEEVMRIYHNQKERLPLRR
jgi:hypothetical protein